MTDHILGVDISKANLDVHLIPTGETQQFANSTVGFRRLIAWLRERPVSRVVYEPTGPWHRDFERALGKAGLPLSRVNPLQARRFAQALGQKAKTDAIDARILAAMGRVLDLPRSRPSSQWQTELRELHTARQALIKDRTATLNRQKQARVPLLKRQCASRLRHIERQLKALEAEMAKHVKADPAQARAFEILNSIPGNLGHHRHRRALGAPGDWLARPQGRGQSGRPGAGHAAIRHLARAQLRPRGPAKAAPGALHAGCLSDRL